MSHKKKESWLKKFFIFLIEIPYFIFKGIAFLVRKIKQERVEEKIEKKRETMRAKYEPFSVVETQTGNFSKLEKKIFSQSKIGIILGARGSGKTAFGIKLLENMYTKTNKRCFAMGFKREEMPSWINVVNEVNLVANNSIVLVDEGGILFSSRKAMSSANKVLSDLILISRHKNLTILFISQNSSNLDVNIIRQADFLVLKHSSLLQKDFERKIVKEIYESVEGKFKKYEKEDGIGYVYSDDFRGFITNPLPSFWTENLGKGFR